MLSGPWDSPSLGHIESLPGGLELTVTAQRLMLLGSIYFLDLFRSYSDFQLK